MSAFREGDQVRLKDKSLAAGAAHVVGIVVKTYAHDAVDVQWPNREGALGYTDGTLDLAYTVPAKIAKGEQVLAKKAVTGISGDRVSAWLGNSDGFARDPEHDLVYIAGPMTGIYEFNFPAFFTAEEKLLELGYDPINPATHDQAMGFNEKFKDGSPDPEFDLRTALLWDLKQVAMADYVAVLPGWETSKGAAAEVTLAHALGVKVFTIESFASYWIDARGRIAPPKSSSVTEPVRHAPKLIGIGGLLAAGKDTVADYLVDKKGFVKLNMSDPLHQAMLALNPLVSATSGYRYADYVEEFGYTRAKTVPEVRRLLQTFGTEVGRQLLGEDVWVDFAEKKIEKLMDEGKSVVITGIRFENELGMITQQIHGATWWVSRNETALTPSNHASENTLSRNDFDKVIHNDSTLSALYELVDKSLG